MADGTLETMANVSQIKARGARTADMRPTREGKRGRGSEVRSEGEKKLMRSQHTSTMEMSRAEGVSGRRVDIKSQAEGVRA